MFPISGTLFPTPRYRLVVELAASHEHEEADQLRITQSLSLLPYPGNYSGHIVLSNLCLVDKALRDSPAIKENSFQYCY